MKMGTSSNQATQLQSYLRPGEVVVVCVAGGPWEGSCGFKSALLPLPAPSQLSGDASKDVKYRRKICLRTTEAHYTGGGVVDCIGNSRAVGRVCRKPGYQVLLTKKYTVRRKIGYTKGTSGLPPCKSAIVTLLRPCSTRTP